MKTKQITKWAGSLLTIPLLYQAAVVQAANPKLLAYWDFNNASNPVKATDKIYGFEGALEGGAVFTPTGGGRTGAGSDRAVDFGADDGVGELMRVAQAPFLNVAAADDQITIVFWEKLAEVVASSAFWGVSPSSNQNQRGIQAHVPWSDRTIYYDSAGCCDGPQRINKTLDEAFDATSWHHFAFVKNKGVKEIWIDGVKFHSGTGAAPLPTDFVRLMLGSNDVGGNNLHGAEDDFAVYAGALSEAQIVALAGGTAPDKIAGIDVPTGPLLGGAAATPAGFSLEITETAVDAIQANSITLKLDGASVTPTSTTKAGLTTTVSYSLPAGTFFPPGSTHTVDISVKDALNAVTSATRSFSVVNYKLLSATTKVTADTSKPGFQWNVAQNNALNSTDNQRAEDQLAGKLIEAASGVPYENTADPSVQGAAIAAAAAANPSWAPLKFEIAGVINLDQAADQKNGNFPDDAVMPGIGSNLSGIAAEIITYIDLPAGLVTMGINSDDGFATAAGQPFDAFQSVKLGEFNGGRGAADTIFYFVAPEAGVYPFRTIYEEGGGGANIEWFTVKADGSKVLVNDTANGGFKSYRATTTPLKPYVRAVSPSPAPRQLNGVSSVFSVTLSDGSSENVDDSSVVVKLDGKVLTTTKQRSGKLLTITYQPDGLQIPSESHVGELSFKGTGATVRTEKWNFRNLKSLILPTPKFLDTFDSYAQDTQPTGWTAWNFTAHCADGKDITSQTSESYENWVLTDVANIAGIDGGRPFNITTGQFVTINGKKVELLNADPPGGVFPEWIMSGNVLYAESDSRCNADSRGAADFPNNGQTQFITTKPYDLSAYKGVVVSFSSIYEQNQDSLGAVEYSVDGGTSWLPVMYFLEEADIRTKADGSVDAVATFKGSNSDTSSWVVDGITKGDIYGDGLGAPITDALSDYVVPRINDGQVEGKRIEVARLDKATGKSDVRLRFGAMGTDSWYFAIDNLAFYDIAGAVVGPPALSLAPGVGSVVATFEGSLQQSETLGGPWSPVIGSSPLTISAPSGNKFYRAVR